MYDARLGDTLIPFLVSFAYALLYGYWLSGIAIHIKRISELQSIICHMGAQSVTCHQCLNCEKLAGRGVELFAGQSPTRIVMLILFL